MTRLAAAVLALAVLSGCVAYTVVDTAVDVTTTAVGAAVGVTAGAVDLVIPDSDDED
ncbi:MAG: hypothetical protein AAFV19_21075 [Pseudomonadota bacterium]